MVVLTHCPSYATRISRIVSDLNAAYHQLKTVLLVLDMRGVHKMDARLAVDQVASASREQNLSLAAPVHL